MLRFILPVLFVLALSVECSAASLQEFNNSGGLVLGFKSNDALKVVAVCRIAGLSIVGGSEEGGFVICRWRGKLKQKQLDLLKPVARYVEPVAFWNTR